MALSIGQQARWWGIGLVVFIAFLWLVSGALLPFVAGAALAYFLDPVADRLETWGLSRVTATVVITLVALVVFVLCLVILVPLIVSQTTALIQSAPQYVASLIAFLTERFPALLEEDSIVRQGLSSVQDTVREQGISMLNGVLSSSLAVVDFLMLLIVAPVVAFYLLMDWDNMVARIDSWLPREHAPVIRDIASQIDAVLAGFVRGQMTVGLILGSFYAIALALIGLQFGVVVGLLAGLVTFIPYVGSTFGGVTSVGLALFQFWDDPIWIAVVAGVFVAGQLVEGNFLTPKLVGGSVGLHPVWLMFALYAFGALFGFAGLLIAVPVAACIGVLGRFALKSYLAGRLYRGPETDEQ